MRWLVAVVTVAACYQPLDYTGGGSGSGSGSAGNAVDQLGVGARFACALDGSAQIACWGNNSFGQLGTGPAAVGAAGAPTIVAAPGPWTQLAVGAAHACGISGGSAYCWGDDTYDQLGGPAAGVPTAVPIDAQLVQIAAGAAETCAIDSGSNLWCWGNVAGGDVTGSDAVEFRGLWSQVSVGYDHACGVVDTGAGSAVECWGTCADEECGSMTVTALYDFPAGSAAPARVFAGDRETCALDVDGHLGCYGIDPNLPGWGVDPRVWTDLAIGPSANSNVDVLLRCGVTDGLAECWGEDALGGLGDGTWFHGIVSFTQPVTVGPADHVALGVPYAEQTDDFDEGGCLIAGSAVSCWGDNRSGELPSLQVPVQGPTPITVAGVSEWDEFASSSTHTCALGTTDFGTQLYCWGQNDLAEVTGSADDSRCPDGICAIPVPASLAVTGDIERLVVGEGFTCVEQGDNITCWGDNSHGQLGGSVQGHVNTLSGNGLVGSGFAACASLSTTECWGWFEPLGSAAMVGSDPSTAPLDPLGGALPVQIVFAADSQCAYDGSNVECWGVDVDGELGDGSVGDTGNNLNAQTALSNVPMTSLSGSFRHYCGLDMNSNVECWGTSIDGESGPGSSGPNDTLQDQAQTITSTDGMTLTDCSSVAVGQDYSCALCDNAVWCWGDALFGALGDGRAAPAQPSSPEGEQINVDPPFQIAGGGLRRANHTCSESEAGQLSCWGFGPRGELGTGGRGSAGPVAVAVP